MDWLNLAVRWFHVVAGIAWIGASFYFIWLDLNLREPPAWKKDRGIKGELWAIHGGGIYEIGKYRLRPQVMPERLHWFKWEAYSTWLSGSLLLILLYYLQAKTYLIGADSWLDTPGQAIAASLIFIALGQVVYEVLLRTPLARRGLLFAAALLFVIAVASGLAQKLFSGRAAYLHVGAMIATWMAGNVFWGIIPSQKAFVAAVKNGREPDAHRAEFAKLRSTHNNYLTLPVIFCMVSNHYPFLYGHSYAWLLLVAVGVLLAWGRHYFNLKHQGTHKPWILASSGAGMVLVAVMASIFDSFSSLKKTTSLPSDLQVAELVSTHCANCHGQEPSHPGFQKAPAGLVIDSPATLAAQGSRARVAVRSGYMPLGNTTELTEEHRAALVLWLNEQETP